MDFTAWRRGGARLPKRFEPTATEQDILYCFRLLLGRNPKPDEWPAHVCRVGMELEAVVGTYVNSLEFFDRGLIKREYGGIELKKLENFSIYAAREDIDVGAHILNAGIYEPHVSKVLKDRLRPGMTLVDIGANIGYFSLMAASLVGEEGRVFAVEPNSQNAKLLKASQQANGFDNITIIQTAAGRELALLSLNPSHSNAVTSQTSGELEKLLTQSTVPCLKLDDVIPAQRRVDGIKIDIEGAEYDALCGFAKRIERDHPFIVSEFCPDSLSSNSGVAPEAYLQFFIDRGYRISVICPDGRLTDCGADGAMAMEEFRKSGTYHIDLLAA